ncbi:metal-dependent phosphohydrolase [Mucilaginibacter paludis]|uniref:Metal dependent phosphohydrolase n=1 Tax=Mucilaginibacter paludis DSM 18603 TaxID=714943 RepID=H1Y1C6_9SPHI|nr:metal-dependent phosphohydrolase [Mucilaginibacter paludis]EHQ30260.1 metal dependent phosphohydrolase [Mucilaginibacter paludis DSM 18603]
MSRTEQLAHWVELNHTGQIKRYTGQPVFSHLATVAEMAKPVVFMGYEIGLCHDLLEDTDTTANQLVETLTGFGYGIAEARYIADSVTELTDVYVPSAYPHLGKKARKEKEAIRLQTISAAAQTIKYCDLIDNMQVVIQYEERQVVAEYLRKKKLLIESMVKGDERLRHMALQVIKKARPAASPKT